MDKQKEINEKIENNLKLIIDYLKQKKYKYLKTFDISKISVLADYFVIISLENMRAVESLKSELTDFLQKNSIDIRSKEGEYSPWILLDLNEIIIHIFNEDDRQFYDLEKIWADANIVDYS